MKAQAGQAGPLHELPLLQERVFCGLLLGQWRTKGDAVKAVSAPGPTQRRERPRRPGSPLWQASEGRRLNLNKKETEPKLLCGR